MNRNVRPAACVLVVSALALLLAHALAPAETTAPKKPPAPRKPAPTQPAEDPSLPRVLILGDSISMGYTPHVRTLMKGKANVIRPGDNCQSTRFGLERLDAWLGKGKWDVIHFNFGLHDLKYVDAKNQITDVDKGKQLVPLPEYEKNLRELVGRLKKTGAALVWCSTTPVPEGAKGRVPGDDIKYNRAALKVMQEAGVEVNDLHAFAADKLSQIQQPRNVHFTDAGSKELAKAVVDAVQKQLEKKK